MRTKLNNMLEMTRKLPQKSEINQQYTTNEDFGRMNDSLKKLLVLGCTGSGKSTLLNKLTGFKLEWDENNSKLVWDRNPIFESNHSVDSVTKNVSYANINPFIESYKTMIVVDTPGHDDSDASDINIKKSRVILEEHAGDLYSKLRNMGYLNTILVLHNDIQSNRLNPSSYTLLQKIDQMFENGEGNIWDHVVIAYSKCDEKSISWKNDLENKIIELQKQIKQKFPNCQSTIPVYTFSGIESDLIAKDFDKLLRFVNQSADIPTTNITKFEGMDTKLEKLVKENHFIQRISDARLNFSQQTIFSIFIIFCFCIRNILFSFLNFNGIYDELLLVSICIYICGPIKVLDWLLVTWDDYFIPFLYKK